MSSPETAPDLFSYRPPTRQDQLVRTFARYFRENPRVWERFCEHSLALIARGVRHYSALTLVCVIRFERDLEAREAGTGFRINNNAIPFYARLFELAYPEHEGFFQKRRLISEDRPPRRGVEPGVWDQRPDKPNPELDELLRGLLLEAKHLEEIRCNRSSPRSS